MTDSLYPSTLIPDHEETYRLEGVSYTVPAVSLVFKRWEGVSIANTFGGKPLVDYNSVPMFAELAIYQAAIQAGWSARWIETYAAKGNLPYFFVNWLDAPLPKQVQTPVADAYQNDLLARIARGNNNSFSGCWDVLVWQGERTIFLESKRFKKDSIRHTQLRWLTAGLSAGLALENFLIVQWKFSL